MGDPIDEKKYDEEASASPNAASVKDDSPSAQVEIDPAKEKALLRKIDAHVVPFIVLLYLFSFLDRGVLGL